jgi:hypothetical protein
MAEWKTYRMWYQLARVVSGDGGSAEQAGNWKPSDFTFRGRTPVEAQGKAQRFWRDAELGAGAVTCMPEGERP